MSGYSKPLKSKSIAIVIFGATGDLSMRMLLPSLESIHSYDPFSEASLIIGVARNEYKDSEIKQKISGSIEKYSRTHNEEEEQNLNDFLKHVKFISGDFTDPATYQKLKSLLDQHKLEGVLVYFATPPSLIQKISDNLYNAGLSTNKDRWVRIVIEKPFGSSYETALALNDSLHEKFNEEDIYRIDHYLAKETVMNIFTFRWGNTIWEPLWNRNYISHVEILVAESVDVGNRTGYYDGVSVIRDMIQNHLLQMLAIVAMEPPSEMTAKSIRDEKVKVLRAIRSIKKQDVILGQYLGYKEHNGVSKDSTTPTFAYIRFFIDNWRWKDVPFYICSGKALAEKKSCIKLVFHEVPHAIFGDSTINKPNVLEIKVQPHEGIILKQHVKVPGVGLSTAKIPLSFYYKDKFGENALQGAYERVILDAIHGDQSFFPRSDEIEQCWKIVEPILKESYPEIIPYAQKMDITTGTTKRNRVNQATLAVFRDAQELVQSVTERLTRLIVDTVEKKGTCTIALSGGLAPRPIYSLLATAPYTSRIDFSKVHIFFVAERCVPPTDIHSNYNMINEMFLKYLKIPEGNIHRMKGELDYKVGAKDYEEEIKKYFNSENPEFDIILLGLGIEGHTASLFPGTDAINDHQSLIIGNIVPHDNLSRITMGAKIINNANNILMINTEPENKDIIDLVFNAPFVPAMIPAQLIQPTHGKLTWFTIN